MSATFLKTKNNRGITLVETIIYMALLILVMGVITQTLIVIGGVYRNIKLTREIESSGTIAMESILREIRNASNVVTNESVFGVSPGMLTVAGVDESLNTYNLKFNVASGYLQISKNGETPTALTSSLGTVSYLLFSHVATSTSEGVKIELEISGTSGSTSKSERFYGFAILRGSY